MRKDFGAGFYVTTDEKQARKFVKSSIGKAKKNGYAIENESKGDCSAMKVSIEGDFGVCVDLVLGTLMDDRARGV